MKKKILAHEAIVVEGRLSTHLCRLSMQEKEEALKSDDFDIEHINNVFPLFVSPDEELEMHSIQGSLDDIISDLETFVDKSIEEFQYDYERRWEQFIENQFLVDVAHQIALIVDRPDLILKIRDSYQSFLKKLSE